MFNVDCIFPGDVGRCYFAVFKVARSFPRNVGQCYFDVCKRECRCPG